MPASDKPRVSFNLDSWEREGKEPEPFVAVLGGKPYTFARPGVMPWQELTEAQEKADGGDVRPLLRLALGDKYEEFLGARDFPTEVLGELIRRWQRHYGATASGEPDASSRS